MLLAEMGANRLSTTTQTGGGGVAFNYKYDRFGNRWQQNVTAGSGPMPQYNFDNNNHITPTSCSSTTTICYDVAGNLLQDTFHTYTYDAEGRILTVDGGATSYVYDAMGHRVQRTKAGVVSFFAYDLAGRDIAEYQNSAGVRFEGYAGGRHIVSYSNNLTYFDFQDVVSSERAHITQDGSSYENTFSLPFGDGQLTSGTAVGMTGPTHFTGKERDAESNLDYLGARYYSSTIGRFLTPDWADKPTSVPYAAFGNPPSLNLYTYVLNNPTTSLDADGHFPELRGQCVIAAGCNAYSNEGINNYAEEMATEGFANAVEETTIELAQNQTQTETQQNQQTQQDPNQPVLMAQNRTPAQGQPPDSTVTIPDGKGGSTDRIFGSDGRAVKDIDKGHDHGAGDPHAHDWDWSKARPRGPGRPLTPEEKQALKRVGEGAAAVGTGYIIYRVVRMAPSVLIPPLWETIPLNAVIP